MVATSFNLLVVWELKESVIHIYSWEHPIAYHFIHLPIIFVNLDDMAKLYV